MAAKPNPQREPEDRREPRVGRAGSVPGTTPDGATGEKSPTTGAGPGAFSSFPTPLGKYTLIRKLGQGGMGAVYLATDTTLKRSVALKVLPPEKADNPTLKKRFRAEAEAAACLHHENIVAIYETGEIDGHLFLALEYVDGTDTANLVSRRGTLPIKRSIEVIRQIALALQHAATHRLVHRDIKPGNILIRRDGVAKLADLGLARTIDAHIDTSITRSGTTVGTIDYISPEQARSSKLADERSDLYSLGCTWYFLLTGEPPFPDGDVTNKLQAHATRPCPNPRDKNPQVPEGLTAVLRRLTEKDPARRYQSAAELLEDLEVIQHGGEQLSRAILQEETADADSGDVEAYDEAERPRRRSRATRPVTARDLPRSDRQPLLPDREPQGSELTAALKKFGVLGGGVAAALAALIWLATQLTGGGGDGSEQNLGKELANAAKREVRETRIGGQGNPGGPVIGSAPGAGDPAANNRQIGEAGGVPSDVVPGAAVPPGNVAGGQQQLGGTGTPTGPGTMGGPPGTGGGPRAQADLAALPAWVSAPGGGVTSTRPTLSVDLRKGAGATHTTLNAALRAVTSAGARIELRGPGPYVLKADVLRDAGRVTLVATDRAELPLVVLQPPDAGAVHAFLTCLNTTLEVEGVHFAADVTGYQTQPSDALLHVAGGDLIVRDASFTARGLPVTGMTAVRVGGSVEAAARPQEPARPAGGQGGQGGVVRGDTPDGRGGDGRGTGLPVTASGGPRVLVQRTVMRGANLAAVRLEAPRGSVVLHDSLLLTGQSPGVQCLPGDNLPAQPGVTAGTSGDAPEGVQVTLAGVTLVSELAACDWTLPEANGPPGELVFHNSLVTTPKGDQPVPERQPVLLRVAGVAGQLAEVFGPTGRLRCRVQNSVLAGWSGLIGLSDEPTGVPWVKSPDEWLALQPGSGLSDRSAPRVGWPVEPTGEVWRAPLGTWNRESAQGYRVEAAGGGWPGCDVSRLTVSGLGALDVVRVLSARPTAPDRLTGWGGVTQTLTVDVTRDDLGKVLAERALAAGTTVVVQGAGICGTSPVVLRNKRVRLVFEQRAGRPLVLTPKAGGNVNQPLFVVEGGVLRLERGAVLAAAPGSRAPLPPWLIVARDADVVIAGCRLQGLANQAETVAAGLIRMERSAVEGVDDRPPHWLQVTDSLLLGGARGIEADARRTVLQCENSVVCVAGTAFSLTIADGDTRIAGVVDLRHCTLSAGETYVRVTPGALSRPAIDPLQFFVDRCVLGPRVPAGGGRGGGTVLEMPQAGWDGGQVTWWENSTGYAPDVATLARVPGAEAAVDPVRDWVARWGAERCGAMLTGENGVLLRQELPTRWVDLLRIEVGAFELHANSRGATWDGGAAAIGARIAQLKIPSTEQTAPPARPGATGTTTPPRQPGF